MHAWAIAASSVHDVTTWIPFIAAGILAWIFVRGGGVTAIASLQAANRELEKRVHKLEAQAESDAKTIAELRARTDYAAVMETHEARALERHTALTAVLTRIADRLEVH